MVMEKLKKIWENTNSLENSKNLWIFQILYAFQSKEILVDILEKQIFRKLQIMKRITGKFSELFRKISGKYKITIRSLEKILQKSNKKFRTTFKEH